MKMHPNLNIMPWIETVILIKYCSHHALINTCFFACLCPVAGAGKKTGHLLPVTGLAAGALKKRAKESQAAFTGNAKNLVLPVLSQKFKMGLWMRTCRAHVNRLGSLMNITAVPATPFYAGFFFKHTSLFQVGCQV